MATARRAAPVVLAVLDGWGWRAERDGNAIALANTPIWDQLMAPRIPARCSTPAASPWGSRQDRWATARSVTSTSAPGGWFPRTWSGSTRASSAASSSPRLRWPTLAAHVRQNGGTLHLLGLLGNGGVHAMDRHLLAAIEAFVRLDVPRIAIQGFLDGRDSAPDVGGRLRGAAAAGHRPARRRAHRDRLAHRPLLRHGSRQALGTNPPGMGSDGAGHGHRRHRPGGRDPRGLCRAAKPTSSSSRW